jgi:hypothetical protein
MLPTHAVPSSSQRLSENKKFAAEISESELGKSLLSIFRMEAGGKRLFWSRKLVAEDEEDSTGLGEYRIVLSNDGERVVLVPEGSEDNVLRLVTREGLDRNFDSGDVLLLLENHLNEASEEELNFGSENFLDVLLDRATPPIYGMWLPPINQWLALDLQNGVLKLAESAQKITLDQIAARKARQMIEHQRPRVLRKVLGPVKEKAAKILPGLISTNQLSDEALPEIAYLFLAEAKQPGDRKYFEELLQTPLSSGGEASMDGDCRVWSRERSLGDVLLSEWESNSLASSVLSSRPESESALKHLGEIRGAVKLPFPLPERPGNLFIYLFPAVTGPGDWAKSASVVKAAVVLEGAVVPGMPPISKPPRPPSRWRDLRDEFGFSFSTLTPGEYKLKAVWDRRPPLGNTSGDSPVRPSPGDYESAESSAIKVGAGEVVTNITLFCTNRVGKAEEYFSADDIWKSQHPLGTGRYSNPAQWLNRGFTEPETKNRFEGGASTWVIKTNRNDAGIHLSKFWVVESGDGSTDAPHRTFEARIIVPKAPKREAPNYDAALVDEHGCRFTGTMISDAGRIWQFEFPIIPFGSALWQLEVSADLESGKQQTGSGHLSVFTLTNRCKVEPQTWAGEPLPIERKFGSVNLKFTSVDSALELPTKRRRYDLPPRDLGWMQRRMPGVPVNPDAFSFTSAGAPSPGWKCTEILYSDRWGNVVERAGELCRKERQVRVRAAFERDVRTGQFEPEEKWQIPIPKVPEAGAGILLSATNILQGATIEALTLAGPGEFVYQQGRIVSGTNVVSSNRLMRLPGGRQVALPAKEDLKIFVRPGNRLQARSELVDGESAETVVARVPYAVVRWGAAPPEVEVDLLESDESSNAPFAPGSLLARLSMQRTGGSFRSGSISTRTPGLPRAWGKQKEQLLQYIPLSFQPGDTNRTLTFIAQKPLEVDFVVELEAKE